MIDRGPAASLVKLILYSNQGDEPVTVVQGDGLIMSTPTGSTAYSLSAGGSMVHPNVNAILLTPICAHSLSFRPILIPDSATLRVKVAEDARSSAWISFDGRPSIELHPGDWVVCRYSQFPVPAILPFSTLDGEAKFPGTSSDDWLSSLRTALHWNVNATQATQRGHGTGGFGPFPVGASTGTAPAAAQAAAAAAGAASTVTTR